LSQEQSLNKMDRQMAPFSFTAATRGTQHSQHQLLICRDGRLAGQANNQPSRTGALLDMT
jgi:hypothetical protein